MQPEGGSVDCPVGQGVVGRGVEAGGGGDGGESEGGGEGGGGDTGMDDGDSRNVVSARRCVNLCTFKRVVVERLHRASRSLPGL